MSETLTMNEAPADPPVFTPDEMDSLKVGEELEQAHAAANPLLAGKFKETKDLENAYLELQQKLGRGETQQAEPEQEAIDDAYTEDGSVNWDTVNQEYGSELGSVFQKAQIDPFEMSDHFYENGELSQDHYSALEEAGFSRATVDQYLNGADGGAQQVADLSDQDVSSIKQSVGGEEKYTELMTWAAQNLPADYVQGFDDLVGSGNAPAIQMAVSGLQNLFEQNFGREGETLTGKPAQSNGNVFRSQAELLQAIDDPRYQSDPAYRQDIMDKLAASDIDF